MYITIEDLKAKISELEERLARIEIFGDIHEDKEQIIDEIINLKVKITDLELIQEKEKMHAYEYER